MKLSLPLVFLFLMTSFNLLAADGKTVCGDKGSLFLKRAMEARKLHPPKHQRALILGGGAFGTANAQILSENFQEVVILVTSRDPERIARRIAEIEELKARTDADGLNINIQAVGSFEEAFEKGVESYELMVFGLPTKTIKPFTQQHRSEMEQLLGNGVPMVSLSKGIDIETQMTPQELFVKYLPDYEDQFFFLSGGSFAKQMIRRELTEVSIAGIEPQLQRRVLEMYKTDYFILRSTDDVVATQYGGALKNIYAIGAGIMHGLDGEDNSLAVIQRNGLQESMNFILHKGGRAESLMSPAVIGDFYLTTSSFESRNFKYGVEVAQEFLAGGKSAQEILQYKLENHLPVVEGYYTTRAMHSICRKEGIDCRIIQTVYRILYEDAPPTDLIEVFQKQTGKGADDDARPAAEVIGPTEVLEMESVAR